MGTTKCPVECGVEKSSCQPRPVHYMDQSDLPATLSLLSSSTQKAPSQTDSQPDAALLEDILKYKEEHPDRRRLISCGDVQANSKEFRAILAPGEGAPPQRF